MRLTLTICAMLMAAAVPVKACEDMPGVQASFVEPALIAALAADQPAAAAIDLSAATDKKPAKKVMKKKKEKVEYMRSAS
jgi:hypothetical protein